MVKITLKAARVNAEMLQTDVALALGVNVATIGHWESGKTLPNGYHLSKLCELYGVELSDISLPEKFR